MKKFFTHNEAIEFAEKSWKKYFDAIEISRKIRLLSIQSFGRSANNRSDEGIIREFEATIKEINPVKENLILYRGSKEKDFHSNRPFLSTSFLKKTALSFVNERNSHLYKILVRKGARVIPTCAMGVMGCEYEQEVVIETNRLHRVGLRTFIYK